jgi:1-deoxy-D-xylulose-5-phosphate synthase
LKTADILSKQGLEAEVINARFVTPLDKDMLQRIARSGKKIYTLEEGVATAGFGSAVLEFFAAENLNGVIVKCLALPDVFIEHGSREELLREYHLTPEEIALIVKAEK